MFQQLEEQIQSHMEWLQLLVEMLCVIVIAAGVVVALVGLLRCFIASKGKSFTPIRLSFVRYPTLALDVQLAADSLSPSSEPTWDRIGKLAAIDAIRTGLNYFLSQETKGEKAIAEPASCNTPPGKRNPTTDVKQHL